MSLKINFVIDFPKIRQEFRDWILSKVSEDTAKRYLKYLDEYLDEPIESPDDLREIINDVKAITKGGLLRWVSSAISNLLNFYEKVKKVHHSIIDEYRNVLEWEKSSSRDVFISEDEIRKAYEVTKRKGQNHELLFKLILYSGIRAKHAVRMLNEYDPTKLVVVNDKVARYPIHKYSAGKKKGYWAYMPLSFAKQLERLNLSYDIRGEIIYGKVSANTLRKWHATFLIRHKVSESIVEFIQGRANVTVGSVHYYQKTQLADEAYTEVVDKFPI